MDEVRRELVLRWIAKAENDWLAIRNIVAGERVPWDAVCFHCQQVAEKYLKALLVALDIEFEPVHNLPRLCRLAMPQCSELNALVPAFNHLNEYSVHVRYPDDWCETGSDEGNEATHDAEVVRSILRIVISTQLGEHLPDL